MLCLDTQQRGSCLTGMCVPIEFSDLHFFVKKNTYSWCQLSTPHDPQLILIRSCCFWGEITPGTWHFYQRNINHFVLLYSRTCLERPPHWLMKHWSLKTGGLWWQVQLQWDVGPSARNIWSWKTVCLSWQWSLKTGLYCVCYERAVSKWCMYYRPLLKQVNLMTTKWAWCVKDQNYTSKAFTVCMRHIHFSMRKLYNDLQETVHHSIKSWSQSMQSHNLISIILYIIWWPCCKRVPLILSFILLQ